MHYFRGELRGSSILLLVGLLLWSGPPVRADEQLWAAIRAGDAVVLIRHALAPGVGDPSGFRLEDCATQRNLSEQGRRQAQAIGATFRRNGVTAARVLSSRWCRCLETARLLGLGAVEPFPLLDSFFEDPGRADAQTAALRAFLDSPHAGPLRVLVTHQVNITALTGVTPRSGEMIVVQPVAGGGVRLVGRLGGD